MVIAKYELLSAQHKEIDFKAEVTRKVTRKVKKQKAKK